MYVKVPPFPPPGHSRPDSSRSSPRRTSRNLSYWSTILTGNSATCTSTDPEFNWLNVRIVHLGRNECHLSQIASSTTWIVMGVPPSFSIDDVQRDVDVIRCIHDNDRFADRAQSIINCINHLGDEHRILQRARDGVPIIGETDSGDEQVADAPIYPAFSEAEWVLVMVEFTSLRRHYAQAKEFNFENAVGKCFLVQLMRFCCVVVDNKMDQENLKQSFNMGTSHSGTVQPGCSQFKKIFAGRRGRSTPSPAPSASGENPSPAPTSTPQMEMMITKKYPDVCYWDNLKHLYSIVGEAKSSDYQPVEDQLLDQMFGLFRPYQKMMLGFAVKPNQACIKILEKDGPDLYCRSFPDLNFTTPQDLKQLVRYFFGFIYFLDCGGEANDGDIGEDGHIGEDGDIGEVIDQGSQ